MMVHSPDEFYEVDDFYKYEVSKNMTILKSERFWGIIAVALLQALVLFDVITSVQGEGLIQIIQTVIGSAIVVRTVDRIGDKMVG